MDHQIRFAARRGKRLLRAFAACEGGAVAVTGALALPALLGVAGLAIEYGDALVTRAETQRVADLAVHAAIVAHDKGGDAQAVRRAAWVVAELNGVSPDETQVSLEPDGSAGPVVRVTITTPRPLVLAQWVAASHSIDVTVRAAARLERNATACVQALDSAGTGITISGGTSITTSGCAVSSNATVTASGGARIVTETLTYDSNSAPSISGGASVVAPDGGAARIIRASAADPLAGHAGVALARARLTAAESMQAPEMPAVVSGQNIEFGWNPTLTQQQATALGCIATISGNTWTFGCPAGATVRLGDLTIGGGLNLDFGMSGTVDTTYSFSGSIKNTGMTMRFGPGMYDIARGITTGGGTTTTFAAGTFRIGRSTSWCGGSTGYSICNTATMSIDGPSVFELVGGVRNTAGATLALGSGTGNSFRFGPSTNGDALTLDGASITTLGDATGAGDRFQLVGNVVAGGGSCLSIGASTNHDMRGRLDLAGGVTFGSGLYAIDGYLHLGATAGGSVWCQGQSVSMHALSATFVISGKGVQTYNNNCNGLAAFCASSGYDSMRLVAPTTGPFAGLAVIGPLSPGVTAGASFGGGAFGSQISGAFYFPNGPITMSGGASAGGGVGEGCLQIVGASVTMGGGTASTSECVNSGASGNTSVRLIE